MPKPSPEPALPRLGAPDQYGFVVPDLATATRAWSTLVGDGDWSVFTYGPQTMTTQTYRGAEGRFRIRIALSSTRPEIELIELLDGPSIYHEWVAEHGYGLHHVGYFVESISERITESDFSRLQVIQSGQGFGADGDGRFAYFDAIDELGVIFELIELPVREPPTESL